MRDLIDESEGIRLRAFLEAFQTASDYMRPYFERAKTWYKQWRFYMDKNDLPYANVFGTRDTLAFVEDYAARMHTRMFSTRPYGTYIPRLSGSKNIAENILQPAVAYFLERDRERFVENYDQLITVAGGYGTGHMTVMPEYGPYWGKRRFTKFDGFEFRPEDYFDVFILPGTQELSHRTWGIFRQSWVPKEEFDAMVAAGVWSDPGDEVGNSCHNIYDDDKSQLLQEIGVLDWWEPHDDEVYIVQLFLGSGHEIVVANNSVEVLNTWMKSPRDPPHPGGIPMIKMDYLLFPQEYLGLGIPELLSDHQKLVNVLISQRVEAVELAMNPVLLYRMGVGLPTDLYDFLPGMHWPVNDTVADIRELRVSDVPQSAYLEPREQKSSMEFALGTFRYGMGQEPEHGREAARTVYWLQQAQQARPDRRARLADQQSFRRVLYLLPLYIRKYVPKKFLDEIVGRDTQEFYDLTMDQLKLQFMAEPVSSSVTNIKQVKQDQAMAKLQMLAQIPPPIMQNPIQPFVPNYYQAYTDSLKEFDCLDPERYLIKLQPPHSQNPMANPNELLKEAGLTGRTQPQPAPAELMSVVAQLSGQDQGPQQAGGQPPTPQGG